MAAHTTRNTLVIPGGIHKANMPRKTPFPQKEEERSKTHTGRLVDGCLSLAGSLLDLVVFLFARPVAEQVEYWQEGSYFYSTAGSRPVRSGDAVSMTQARFLHVGFMYKFQGMQIQGVLGNHEMTARIVNEQSGWQRNLPLTPRCDFADAAWFALSTLDLAQVEAVAAEACSGTFRVEIVTRIRVNGLVRGRYVTDDFEPVLAFRYDQARLLPIDANGRRIPMRFTKSGPLAAPVPAWDPAGALPGNPSHWERERQ